CLHQVHRTAEPGPLNRCGPPVALMPLLMLRYGKLGGYWDYRLISYESGSHSSRQTRVKSTYEITSVRDFNSYKIFIKIHGSTPYVHMQYQFREGWNPKTFGLKYQCVALGLSGKGIGGLNDLDCKKWTKFICMKDKVSIKNTTKGPNKTSTSSIINTTPSTNNKCGKKFINLGGECFYISTEHVNWWIAKETCKMSAVLTTISTDTATNELLIQQELLLLWNFWVGGRFQPWNSSYRWITTSEIINSGWQTGHPKHSAEWIMCSL
ncbi:unnamed protein product, partial [Meganyctiphanes norvegica]